MRIQKYLSEIGTLSRREAEKHILAGLVKVNGVVTKELWTQIDPDKDKVEVMGLSKEKKVTIALNKPRGIVSSRSNKEGETVFDLLPDFKNLNTVGRLDKESDGLLLLSNDGIVTKAVTGSDHKIEKEYEVCVRESIKPRHVRKMEEGIMLEDGMTLPTKVEQISDHCFKIILKEGRHHQIRRMCSAVYLTIESLKRLRIGNITLRGIKQNKFRTLTEKEILDLKKLAK